MANPTTTAFGSLTPSPIFFFQGSQQPITCEPVKITWLSTSVPSTINLIVTNNDVPQDAPAPSLTSSSSRPPNTFSNNRRAVPTGVNDPIPSVNAQIAEGIDPSLQTYTWLSVNIPQGWYIFEAQLPEYNYTFPPSSPIFVHKGDDTSCLESTSTSTSSTSSTSSTGTPSPSTTLLPIVGASSHTNVGTIVGVSLAAVALIAMVITAWLCLLRRGRKAGVLGGGQAASGRWNGLSSVDSRVLTNNRPPSRHQGGRHGSIGTIPIGGSEEAVGAEKVSVYSKSPFEGSGVALSTLPVLQQQTARTKIASRTYSASSSTSNVYSTNEYVSASPGRRPSVQDSIGRRSIDSSNTYPPTSPISPHGRSSSQFMPATSLSRSHSTNTSGTHQASPSQSTSSHALLYQSQQPSVPSPTPQSDPSSPTSPTSDATKQARRQSFGGRKRKPVPAYDPNQDPIPPSLAPSPIPPPSPSPDHPINATSGGHYITRNHAGHDFSQPQLVHKSSFGPGGVEGKPLHYLIPDMPMPVQD